MRYGLLTLCVTLALASGGCMADQQVRYEQAQRYLGCGEYGAAAQLFARLGEYEEAGEYALYCAGLQAMTEGDLSLARADLELVDPFRSSSRYLRRLDALEMAQQGDAEGALRIWESLGSFADSRAQAQALREEILQKKKSHARALMNNSRWEQALNILSSLTADAEASQMAQACRDAMLQAEYDRAQAMYDAENFAGAMAAFEALGDALDARARAIQCRSAMYRQLEEDFRHANLATASELMERYAEMEDYLDSPQRLSELQARYALNLTMAAQAEQQPYIRFGSWDGPLLWRLVKAEDSTVTLRCVTQPDLAGAAEDFPILTAEEQAGVLSVQLPAQMMLEQHGGVCPVLELSLDRFFFTQGSGTAEDPYR